MYTLRPITREQNGYAFDYPFLIWILNEECGGENSCFDDEGDVEGGIGLMVVGCLKSDDNFEWYMKKKLCL